MNEPFYIVPKSLHAASGYYSFVTDEVIPLTHADKAVYVFMLDRHEFFVKANKQSHFESMTTIGNACNLTRQSVQRITDSFEKHGVIRRVKLRPNGMGQWRWHYTHVADSLKLYTEQTIVTEAIMYKPFNKTIKQVQSIDDSFDDPF